MGKRYLLFVWLFSIPFSAGGGAAAQHDASRIHVSVVLVQLNIAVTDRKGNYISGLRPEDFAITEDKIQEKTATFEEGNEPPRRLIDVGPSAVGHGKEPDGPQSAGDESAIPNVGVTGANVFVLFDTSNYMYRGFVFAQDAIADFVRSLEGADKVAFYSYSRDLSRAALLTADRAQVLRAARTTVAGDDAALYNCLLLTVQDAAHFTGRKVIVVFSNGPDNYRMEPPKAVAERAQSTGPTVYMVSNVD